MKTYREGLPRVPEKMQALPVDERGYPVPWFVDWVEGKPDHRLMDAKKIPDAIRFDRCWICGEAMGKYRSFCMGPMGLITLTQTEPPSHLDCLRFAVKACPHLTSPSAKHRDTGIEEAVTPVGTVQVNPGTWCLATTREVRIHRYVIEERYLFRIGPIDSAEWYRKGKPATRADVDAGFDYALGILRSIAKEEDTENPEAKHGELLEARYLEVQAWINSLQLKE